jgi:hypothetical protein
MGLKSGSRDAGLDDSDEEESAEPEDPPQANESQVQTESASTSSEETGPGETDPEEKVVERDSSQTSKSPTKNQQTSEPKSTAGQQTMSSIPYKLRRDKVNEGREQVPYFLREEVIEAEDEFQDTLEDLVGEDVYKSDYREASMVVAQRNPELVAEVLREWGYDLDSM